MRQRLIAGNWKMNGTGAELEAARRLAAGAGSFDCAVVICPPSTLLERLSRLLAGSPVRTGGQDCHAAHSGAHTGDVSAVMLAEAGATHCIVGHSERRGDHGESNELACAKATAAIAAGLTAILCIGETEDERRSGNTLAVIGSQLAECIPDAANDGNLVIAYEPIWAIGTGNTATPGQIAEVHAFIRSECAGMPGRRAADDTTILYGGSVNQANAAGIFSIDNVDGGLVGGASLISAEFAAIIQAA